MVRLLLYVALVLVLGFGFAWLADRPGLLMVTWQGQQIEMSLMVAVSAVVALVVIIMFGWWLIKSLLNSPQVVTRYFQARKRDRGYQALSTGLVAAGAGDTAIARKMTQRTAGLLSANQEPLIYLLDAQTALIEGRNDAAREKFEAMVDDPETRELGLRGLYLEARRLGAAEAARHYAEQAAELAPHLHWAAEAALGYRSAEGAWDDAIRLLEKQRVARVLDKAEADRKKAVLLTARGMDKLDKGDIAGARADSVEANRLAPDLVPAGVTAAQALFRENNLHKGSRILEKLWKTAPHPDIAEAYVRARPSDSTLDRLKRVQKLQSIKRNHVESAYTVARAALDAEELTLARKNAEAAARLGARESIYLLLADIEEADTGDQGRVRHWLAQAVRVARDPAWTADGYVSEHWAPVSPVSGRFDAFEWKVPVEQIAGPVEDGEANRASAEQAIVSLLPIAATPPVAEVETAIVFKEDAATDHAEADKSTAPEEKVIDAEPVREPKAETVPEPQPEPVPQPEPAPIVELEPEPEPEPVVEPEPEPVATVEPDGEETQAVAAAEPEKPAQADETADEEERSYGHKVDPAVREAAASGETHIITDAVGEDRKKQKQAAFLVKPLDNPSVKEAEEEEQPKSRFRLF